MIFCGHRSCIEQFWTLAFSVEKPFLESTVTQLGFGLCEAPMPPISAETARARRVGAIKALTERPVHPPKKLLKTATGPASATPLLDQEIAARWKWAARLEGDRAKRQALSPSCCWRPPMRAGCQRQRLLASGS